MGDRAVPPPAYRPTPSSPLVAIAATWGRRCQRFVAFSSGGDGATERDAVRLNATGWRAEYAALHHMWRHHVGAVDWVVRVERDAYVVVENLRRFLAGRDASRVVYLGHAFASWRRGGGAYNVGGGGVVLSRGAVHHMVARCGAAPPGAEDAALGRCLAGADAPPPDTRDDRMRARFLVQPLEALLIPGTIPVTDPFCVRSQYASEEVRLQPRYST